LTALKFYVPRNTKWVISEMFPKPISSLGTGTENLTRQKHAFTNQKKCTTQKKRKPDLVASYDMRPGNRACSVLHKVSLTY